MLPVAVNIKSRGAEVSVAGEKPKDRFANIRKDCYEALVKTAKQLSKDSATHHHLFYIAMKAFSPLNSRYLSYLGSWPITLWSTS